MRELAVPKRFMRITKPVLCKEGDKWARFDPFEGFKVSFAIHFDHPLFSAGPHEATVDFSTHSFVNEVSRARTFGFMHDIETLRQAGLALGGSLDNAIVLDNFRVLNEDGLRYEDEFVRHKLLDAIGDLYLLGYPLIGAFRAHKSGHYLNTRLLHRLMADQEAWELVTYEDNDEAPVAFGRAVPAI
jgi:UDP-3-O-[3-hydroxymyristoyl] N-acetylglucosamine deacetylase